MSIIESLVQMSHSRWIAIKLLREKPEGLSRLRASVRLCEAIHMAYKREFYLTAGNIYCEGAKHCLGWKLRDDAPIEESLMKKTGKDLEVIHGIVKQVPTLTDGFTAIALGHDVEGDVFVSYCTPEGAMRLLRQWQMITGSTQNMPLSSVMAVCGNGLVRAYTTQKICLSFGCPDSRTYGKIYPHQVALAIPRKIAIEIQQET